MRTSKSKSYVLGALLASSVAFAGPALARTEFRGGGVLLGFSGCEEQGWSGSPERVLVRMRPSGLEGNWGDTSLVSMFFGTYAMNIQIPDDEDAEPGEWIQVRGSGLGSVTWTPPDEEQITEVRLISQFPADGPTQSTEYMNFSFEIRNFNFLEGCMVRGHATVAQR